MSSREMPQIPNTANAEADIIRDLVMGVLDDFKAQDVTLLNVGARSIVFDYMIIASGTSERHVKSLARAIVEKIDERRHKPKISGLNSLDWVLVDADEVVVHIFRPEVRDYYKLEKLWSEPRDAHLS